MTGTSDDRVVAVPKVWTAILVLRSPRRYGFPGALEPLATAQIIGLRRMVPKPSARAQ